MHKIKGKSSCCIVYRSKQQPICNCPNPRKEREGGDIKTKGKGAEGEGLPLGIGHFR